METRKSNRLESFDYSQNGAYFITICTENRRQLLSTIVGANCVRPPECILTPAGSIAKEEIDRFSKIYPSVCVDKYVIMPNHIHLLLTIADAPGRTQFAPTVSRIIKQFKGIVTKRVGQHLWQKSFYDHVVRTQRDYDEIWTYIDNNPMQWELDKYYTI